MTVKDNTSIQADFGTGPFGRPVVTTAPPFELAGEVLTVELSSLDDQQLQELLTAVQEVQQRTRRSYASGLNAHAWEVTRQGVRLAEYEAYVGPLPRTCVVPLDDFLGLLLRWRDHVRMVAESRWLSDSHPDPMLDRLWGQASDRKLRLFACACCRRLWHRLRDGRSRHAVEAAEAFADGRIGKAELRRVAAEARVVALECAAAASGEVPEAVGRLIPAAMAVEAAALGRRATGALAIDVPGVTWPGEGGHRQALRRLRAISEAGVASGPYVAAVAVTTFAPLAESLWAEPQGERAAQQAAAAERDQQCRLLRCIFGNPIRPSPLDPPWRTPTALALAQSLYDDREMPSGNLDGTRLAVLADALEEAGCQDQDVLGHLRQQGSVHVRGCFVVDLLLNKS